MGVNGHLGFSVPAEIDLRPASDDVSERAMQVDSDPGNLTKRSAQKVAEPTEEADEPDPKARKLRARPL